MSRMGLVQSAVLVVTNNEGSDGLTKGQNGGAQAEQRQWPGMVISGVVC